MEYDSSEIGDLRRLHAAARESECLNELTLSMVIVAAITLVLSSREYAPSENLEDLYHWAAVKRLDLQRYFALLRYRLLN